MMTSLTRPTHVRAEHLVELFGTPFRNPRLSWWLPEGASEQTGYRLATSDWDSGWVESDEQVLVRLDAPAPGSGSMDEIRVKLRTDLGESDWSEAVAWETGLLDESDWVAEWISPREPEPFEPGLRPIYELAGTLELDAGSRVAGRARAYVTAHGIYELFVNGERIGDRELTPGFTAYGTNLAAQAWDITDQLRAGANRIGVRLSDGWFRGRHGLEREADNFGTITALRLQVVLTAHDGASVLFGTDANWEFRALAETADLMDGQSADLSRAPAVWQPVTVRGERMAEPVASDVPPVRRVQEIVPVSITRIANGNQLVDLGQNISGWCRLTRLGAAGSVITLTHGEALAPDGSITMEHLRGFRVATLQLLGAGQVDTIVSNGDPEVSFEARHSTKGFRYVEVAGHSDELTPADITGIVVHSDLEATGRFSCSDERINRLHEAAVWSLRSNICDIPTDCPQRERSGFTGDWQIYAPTATFLYDVAAFTRKWLRDLAADQWEDGRVPTITPDPGAGGPTGTLFDAFVGSAGWGDAAVLVPWTMWRAYGDRQLLEDQYEAAVAWVRFGERRAADLRHPDRAVARPEPLPHERYLWDAGFHFGEWLEPGEIPRPDPSADHGSVATAYLHHSAGILARIAELLGRPGDARHFGELADNAAIAWREEYLGADGRLTPDSQANHVRALRFGLVPPDQVHVVADRLAALVRENGGHLSTGFLSTADLLPVLAGNGHLDVAWELLTVSGYPSWMEMLDRGATTIWEHWDGIDEHGTPKASLNHYSKGAVISFLHTVVAGIRMDESGSAGSVGYRSFTIAPQPGGGLEWASAEHDGPYGTIRSRWDLVGGNYELAVSIPAGSRATVLLPTGESTEVGPGDHRFGWARS